MVDSFDESFSLKEVEIDMEDLNRQTLKKDLQEDLNTFRDEFNNELQLNLQK